MFCHEAAHFFCQLNKKQNECFDFVNARFYLVSDGGKVSSGQSLLFVSSHCPLLAVMNFTASSDCWHTNFTASSDCCPLPAVNSHCFPLLAVNGHCCPPTAANSHCFYSVLCARACACVHAFTSIHTPFDKYYVYMYIVL